MPKFPAGGVNGFSRRLVWAMFSSFFSHMVDKHENLDNPVFNKCGHKDIIEPRKWLDKGT